MEAWVCLSVAYQGWFAQCGALHCLCQGFAKHSPVLPHSFWQPSVQARAQSLSIRSVPRSFGSHRVEDAFLICAPHYECNLSALCGLARTVPEWVTHQYFTACLKLPTEMKEPYDPIRIKNMWYYCHGWGGISFDKVLCTGKLWLSKNEILGKENWSKIWRLLKYSILKFWE